MLQEVGLGLFEEQSKWVLPQIMSMWTFTTITRQSGRQGTMAADHAAEDLITLSFRCRSSWTENRQSNNHSHDNQKWNSKWHTQYKKRWIIWWTCSRKFKELIKTLKQLRNKMRRAEEGGPYAPGAAKDNATFYQNSRLHCCTLLERKRSHYIFVRGRWKNFVTL